MRKFILITIYLSFSNSLFGQENKQQCDSTVYFAVRQMPLFKGNYDLALANVFQQIDSKSKSYLQNNATYINIKVTCKGNVYVTSTNSTLTEFTKLLENELNKLEWIPGKDRTNYASVESMVSARIENNKLYIPMIYKSIKGRLIKCKIVDETTAIPISDVRLITKYNNSFYYSNQNGEVEFYCDELDKIEISHINYQSFNFNMPENTNSFKIKLTKIIYQLEQINLTIHSPKKLPYKNRNCDFEDWTANTPNQSVYLRIGDVFPPEMAEFNRGIECFYNYIAQEFVLPKEAFENDYTDTVDISFTIGENGTLKNVSLSRHLKYGVDSTLENIFTKMPKWKPAIQGTAKTEQRFMIKLIIGTNKFWKKNYG